MSRSPLHAPRTPHRLLSWIFISFCAAAAVMLLSVSLSGEAEVFSARRISALGAVTAVESSEIADASAPLGVRNVVEFTLPQIPLEYNALAFYTVHTEVQVELNGELVCSLTHSQSAQGSTVGCNWTLLPISALDSGSRVRIVLTPLYESVRSRTVELTLGTQHAIYLHQLWQDLSQLLFSLMVIVIGITYLVMSPLMLWRRRTDNNISYLGAFSLFIGLWKLTDLRYTSMIFPGSTATLSYISLSMLLLAPAAMMLYVRGLYGSDCPRAMNFASAAQLALSFLLVLLQLLGIADLRATLPVCHILLAASGAVICAALVDQYRRGLFGRNASLMFFGFAACVAGLALDLFTFYRDGNSLRVFWTLLAFLFFVLVLGSLALRELNQRARLDMQTGLYNKASCEEQLLGMPRSSEPTGVMMLDLNHLKQANDTLGHKAGDELIVSLARILRKALPVGTFIGRYGGDEFIAILRPSSHEQLDAAMDSLLSAAERHNARPGRIPVSFACGYVLSTDYPGLSMTALLREADALMYEEKRRQHATQGW